MNYINKVKENNNNDNSLINLGFYLILTLSFTRPIISILEGRSTVPINIFIPLLLSYVLLVHLFLILKKIELDYFLITVFVFCSYILLSISWGSSVNDCIKIVLPFICVISCRTVINDKKKLSIAVILLLLGYLIPIVLSWYLIVKGSSISQIDYYSGVIRQKGAYFGAHSLSHSMVYYSFVYVLFMNMEIKPKKYFNIIFHLTFLLSIYCMWNSYVRSAYLSLFLFWSSYFLMYKRKYFYILATLLPFVIVFKYDMIVKIFWKKAEFSLDQASSGRIWLWTHNLELFWTMPFYKKMIGSGLGSELKTVTGAADKIWSSHNDYISLLMTVGIIGLFLYLLIIIILFIDIYRSNIHKKYKTIFFSVLITILFMSMVTNGFLLRFELNQQLWLFIGFYFCLKYYTIPPK